jgi:hypothetical protein
MTIGAILRGVGYTLAFALLLAGGLVIWLGMAISAVRNLVYADRVRARRWRLTPGLGDVRPGSPAWTEREQRVTDLLAAIAAVPVERFDTFDPSGVVGRTFVGARLEDPLLDAAANAPRPMRAALETARWSARHAVEARARRDRPEAFAVDYMYTGAWSLWDPHWVAAERAIEAGATAILLEGQLDEASHAHWAAGVARLLDATSGPGSA